MAKFLLLLIYNGLFPAAVLFMAPAAIKKMKARGGRVRDLWQRLGFFRAEQHQQIESMRRKGKGRLFWMHAASVGEVGIAGKLIREMAEQDPEVFFVLTTTTPTGFAQAASLREAQNGRLCAWLSPLDGWWVVRRFLKAIRPVALVLIEAEVWPNLSHACARAGVPMLLVNARLSPRSERNFRRFLPFTRAIFSLLHQVFVQEPDEVKRWTSLGVEPERLRCTGSIKYDPGVVSVSHSQAMVNGLRQRLRELGWGVEEPILLAASTHPGEEEALAGVFLRLGNRISGLKMIMVPRHVERAAEAARALRKMGFGVVLRSDEAGSGGNLLLVDTTGELKAWQSLATVVVVGKSFLARGGQNPAEALLAGKPVCFGPHMENFEALVDQLKAVEGALQVENLEDLAQKLAMILENPDLATRMVRHGRQVLERHKGATLRTAEALLKLR